MNRILVIGRNAESVVTSLQSLVDAEFDAARLPATGLRQLDATPPDALILADDDGQRMTALYQAVYERPVGQLTPIFVLAPKPAVPMNDAPGIVAWMDTNTHASTLARLLERELGVNPQPANPQPVPALPKPALHMPSLSPPTKPVPTPEKTPAYVLEPLDDEEESLTGPVRLRTQELFPSRLGHSVEEDLDASDVRRKLKVVRHEDYFAILEVPRGAETSSIREAFQHQMSRYSQKRIAFEVAHALHAEIEEIRDALEDAWAVLGDSRLRGSYLEQTTRR